jgi:hypothetical protein
VNSITTNEVLTEGSAEMPLPNSRKRFMAVQPLSLVWRKFQYYIALARVKGYKL